MRTGPATGGQRHPGLATSARTGETGAARGTTAETREGVVGTPRPPSCQRQAALGGRTPPPLRPTPPKAGVEAPRPARPERAEREPGRLHRPLQAMVERALPPGRLSVNRRRVVGRLHRRLARASRRRSARATAGMRRQTTGWPTTGPIPPHSGDEAGPASGDAPQAAQSRRRPAGPSGQVRRHWLAAHQGALPRVRALARGRRPLAGGGGGGTPRMVPRPAGAAHAVPGQAAAGGMAVWVVRRGHLGRMQHGPPRLHGGGVHPS